MKRVAFNRAVGAMVCGIAAGTSFSLFAREPSLDTIAWLCLAIVMMCNALGLLYGGKET